MDEKRPPIDYLFRVRDDLDMILQRKPKAPNLVYDACEAALPHVCAAIGYLDSIEPNQNDEPNQQPVRNFEEMFKLTKEQANTLCYKISEWLAGRSSDQRTCASRGSPYREPYPGAGGRNAAQIASSVRQLRCQPRGDHPKGNVVSPSQRMF